VAGCAGAAVVGVSVAGAATAGEFSALATGLDDWQPVINPNTNRMAKAPAHFRIRDFVFFIKFRSGSVTWDF
jgi:hypothetical protein